MFFRHVVLPASGFPAQRRSYSAVPSISARAFTTLSSLLNSDTFSFSSVTSSDPSPASLLRQRKLDQLLDSMSKFNNRANRVWDDYNSLLRLVDVQSLPRELHEQVLLKCVPSLRRMRSLARFHQGAHPYEDRLHSVVNNITLMGSTPTLEAYHFIIHQFAVCGHFMGAMNVYNELLLRGLNPDPRTYTLCMQGLAHRLAVPTTVRQRDWIVNSVRGLMDKLLTDMRERSIPVSSINLDLIMRIVKETVDYPAFANMMQWAYSIDLTNPDRPLLSQDGSYTPRAEFNTDALNTTLDTLGRLGNVSKLIQAYEVFTTPLPNAGRHFSDSFEDDDDFGEVSPPDPISWNPPYADPNAKTLTILLRHLGQEGKTVLVRHYTLAALEYDIQVGQVNFFGTQTGKIFAPRYSFNHATLMAAYGHANRSGNVGLLKWMRDRIPSLIKRRKAALSLFVAFREECIQRHWFHLLPSYEPQADVKPKKTIPLQERLTIEKSAREYTDQVVEEAQKRAESAPESLVYTKRTRNPTVANLDRDSVLDVDVDKQTPPRKERPRRPMDVDLHIALLERDLHQFIQFRAFIEAAISRAIQRAKERIGRRVWEKKDVYMRTHGRVRITRAGWVNNANFQHKRGPPLLGPAGLPNGKHQRPELWRYWAHRRERVKRQKYEQEMEGKARTELSEAIEPVVDVTAASAVDEHAKRRGNFPLH